MNEFEIINGLPYQTKKAKEENKAQIDVCDGCMWKGKRHQKCSCCRRNKYMKDNYQGG